LMRTRLGAISSFHSIANMIHQRLPMWTTF